MGGGGNCEPDQISWQCETIDDMGSGSLLSGIDVELDHLDRPVIVYQHAGFEFVDLKIARPLEALSWSAAGNCGPLSPTYFPTWHCETMEEGSLWYVQAVGGLSIAMNHKGEATVAYRSLTLHNDEGLLKVAIEPRSVFTDGFESGDTTRWTTSTP